MAAQIGISVIPAVIAAGGSLSPEVDLGAQTLVGIAMPASWVAASLTFQVSVDGGATWNEHYSSAGAETTFTVAAGQYIAVDPTLWRGVNAVKARSGTSASPVTQTGGATLNLVCKFVN
jgi:hypothetical protein